MSDRHRASSVFYSGWQFGLFRVALGLYLTKHFIDLVSYAPEIWSRDGIFEKARDLPSYGFFPNLLFWNDSPSFVSLFVILMGILSLCLALGLWRRWVAFLLWYGWACLLGRNPFIANPSMPFIGLLLLFGTIIPHGEPLSLRPKKNKGPWSFPRRIFRGIWVIMALSYSLSGLHKCLSPSWIDGSALRHILENPLARDHSLRRLLVESPEFFLNLATWSALALEIFFAPLALWSKTRFFAWSSVLVMHLCILCLVPFADLTLGMVLVHFFTLDPRWLAPAPFEPRPIVFFDGVCGLCNGFIAFLFKADEYKVFHVATLQGEWAQRTIPPHLTKSLDSVLVLTPEKKILTKSCAMVWILYQLGGIWRLASFLLKVIPSPLADFVYDKIASNRYLWFGKLATCRLPSAEERERFLD